jgi:anti-anti-sigma factor
MDLSTQISGKWHIINISGNFRGRECKKFRDLCQDYLTSECVDVAINFKEVKFIDSTGVGALIHCHQKVKDLGGKLVLIGPSDDIYDLFEMISINNLFEIVENVEELEPDY